MARNRKQNIVVIGGGTGLSVLLRGLKKYRVNIAAIVTVADDGGSSGRLREEMQIPPPGDVRNVLVALSDVEPLVEALFQHRFKTGDGLSGHSLGNLLLAGMTDITGDFRHAIRELSRVLNVKGKVLPAANRSVILKAQMEDDSIISGESTIPKVGKKIKRVFLSPEDVQPLFETVNEIRRADLIVIGPGSLYTSILPNLLVKELGYEITQSKAKKVYICNMMTQPGETVNYTACDHLSAIYNHIPNLKLDKIFVNKEEVFTEFLEKYKEEHASPVVVDDQALSDLGVHVVKENFIRYESGVVRHNATKLAQLLIQELKNNR